VKGMAVTVSSCSLGARTEVRLYGPSVLRRSSAPPIGTGSRPNARPDQRTASCLQSLMPSIRLASCAFGRFGTGRRIRLNATSSRCKVGIGVVIGATGSGGQGNDAA
jgi:hypothetical protein